ncbi:MAG: NAD(P)-dependent oxidoreductase [Candidatus Amulumruptor caecigallinarius]|nr:NAD(P)-dependent oxidoreductase [Candidatus Amulumruptor caecigallinarius]
MRKRIFITGATGVMGSATLEAFLSELNKYELYVLARPSKKNRHKLAKILHRDFVNVIWGDLCDYTSVSLGVRHADVVLHIGGMVPPAADYHPQQTMRVNVTAAENIVNAIKTRADCDDVSLVYIGSIAQTSGRHEPFHWGRTGDPVMASAFDSYGLSKILAERIIAESGLKRWVSLRQSGILYPSLLSKGLDPFTFHVPLRGVLEWTTIEDSARLMLKICGDNVPESLWRNFYNVGSGPSYRMSNYKFMTKVLRAIKCPPADKIFEPNWFATGNFHGFWFSDSDRLENLLHFRENRPFDQYFANMAKKVPSYFKLAGIIPARLIKMVMHRIASTPGYGTLDWIKKADSEKIIAYFGSLEAYSAIPEWKDFDLSEPLDKAIILNHGYDESKPMSELGIKDMRDAAAFRGGKCETSEMDAGSLDTPLQWRCGRGHRFSATPRSVLLGGHWCPECLPPPWRYDEEAMFNKFLAQLQPNKRAGC